MMRKFKSCPREPVEACLADAAWVASNSVERLGLPREPRGTLVTRKVCLYGDFSTFDTDYILIKEENVARAKIVLEENGHVFVC